jgi:hypothetical protein
MGNPTAPFDTGPGGTPTEEPASPTAAPSQPESDPPATCPAPGTFDHNTSAIPAPGTANAPKIHDAAATAKMLYVAASQSLVDMSINHSGNAFFDFAFNDFRFDNFIVDGVTYDAAAFGNYIAGYAGAYVGGAVGIYLVDAAGIYYDARGDNVFDWDADSRPFIDAGANRGMSDSYSCGRQIFTPSFYWGF